MLRHAAGIVPRNHVHIAKQFLNIDQHSPTEGDVDPRKRLNHQISYFTGHWHDH